MAGEEAAEKVLALYAQLEGLGFPARSTDEVDQAMLRDGLMPILQRVCELAVEAQTVIMEIEGPLWSEVTAESLDHQKVQLQQLEQDFQVIPANEAGVLPTCGEALSCIAAALTRLQPCLRAAEAQMTEEHWHLFFRQAAPQLLIGDDAVRPVPDGFSVAHLMSATAKTDQHAILDSVIAKAKYEEQIRGALREIAARCEKTQVPLANGVPDEGRVQHLATDLEATTQRLRALAAQTDSQELREMCDDRSSSVRDMQQVIQDWYSLRTLCEEHNALFTAPLMRALPQTTEKLAAARERAAMITKELQECPDGVINVLQGDAERWSSVKEALLEGQGMLDEVREVLLEQARGACETCPRLNLLDEPLLLQALAVSSNVDEIRPLLSKLFASVASLVVQSPQADAPPQGGSGKVTVIRGVESFDGEHVLFENSLRVTEGMNVGEWMAELCRRVTHSLHRSIGHVVKQSDALRNGRSQLDLDYFERFPGQISVIGIYMTWTTLIEGALGVPRARRGSGHEASAVEKLQRAAHGAPAAAWGGVDSFDDLGIIEDDDDGDDWEGTTTGLGTILHNSIRPHSANPPVTAGRPLSAASHRQAQAQGRRPNTAEHRLRNLTTPLSQESTVVRPGSAAARPKAAGAEDEKKVNAKETKATVRKGSAKKKAKADAAGDKEKKGEKIEQRLFEKRQLGTPVRPDSASIRNNSGVLHEPNGQEVSNGVSMDFLDGEAAPGSPRALATSGAQGQVGTGRSRWVTSLGQADALAKLKQMHQALVALTLTSLSRLRRAQVESAIAHLTHLISIVNSDEFRKAESADDFNWQRHLRVYRPRSPASGYTLKLGTASVEFGGELHASHTKSVLTPHLAKTWLHLAQAVSLKYGAVASGEGVTACLHDLAGIAGKLMPTFRQAAGAGSGEAVAGQLRAFVIGVMSTGSWGFIPEVDQYSDMLLAALSGLTAALYEAMDSPTSLVSYADINPNPRGSLLSMAAAPLKDATAGRPERQSRAGSAAFLPRGTGHAVPRGPSFFPKLGAALFATVTPPAKAPQLWFPADGKRPHQAAPGPALVASLRTREGGVAIPKELSLAFRSVVLPPVDYAAAATAWLTTGGFLQPAETAVRLAAVMQSLVGLHSMGALGDASWTATPAVLRVAVQKAAAALRRATAQEKKNVSSQLLLILKALREVLLGCAPTEHHGVVEQALADAFPGQHTHVHHMRVADLITQKLKGEQWVPTPAWMGKVLNMYELQMSSRALLLHGGPLTGKTSAFKVLRHVLSQICGDEQPEVRLHPGAHGAPRFWGSIDPATHEWQEGVLAKKLLELSTAQASVAARTLALHSKKPPTAAVHAPKGTAAAAALPLPPPIWLVLDGAFDYGDALVGLLSGAEMTYAYPELQVPIPLAHAHLRVAVETDSLRNVTPAVLTLFPTVGFQETTLPWTATLQVYEMKGSVDKVMAGLFRTHVPDVVAFLEGVPARGVRRYFGSEGSRHFLNLAHTILSLLRFVVACREVGWVQTGNQAKAFWWGVAQLFGGPLAPPHRRALYADVIAPHIGADWLPPGEEMLWDVVLDPVKGFVPAATTPLLNIQYQDGESSFGKHDWKTRVMIPRLMGSAAVLLKLFHTESALNVAVVGEACCGKSTLFEEHLRRHHGQPWARYSYRSSGKGVDAVVADTEAGRCIFLDDVCLDGGDAGTIAEPAAALREMLQREGKRAAPAAAMTLRSRTNDTAPLSALARLASRFMPVYVADVSEKVATEAFSPLFQSVWGKVDKGPLFEIRNILSKLVAHTVFAGAARAKASNVVNAKALADAAARLAIIPSAAAEHIEPTQFASMAVDEVAAICHLPREAVAASWNEAVKDTALSGDEYLFSGQTVCAYKAMLGQTFSLTIGPSWGREFEDVVQKALDPGTSMYPSVVARVAEIGKVLSWMGGNVVAVGAAGSGRHGLCRAAAKTLKFEYAEGLMYTEQLEKVVRAAAQGVHGAWIIPEADSADPANARLLEQTVEGQVLGFLTAGQFGLDKPPADGFTSEPDAYLAELEYSFVADYHAKALETSRYKASKKPEHDASPWALVARHIAMHLHIVVCTRTEASVPNGVRASGSVVRFPDMLAKEDTAAIAAGLQEVVAKAPLPEGQSAADVAGCVGKALHALQGAVDDALKVGGAVEQVPPAVYLTACGNLRRTLAQHTEHCLTRSAIMTKQEKPLMGVSTRLGECTGLVPKAILPDGLEVRYYDGGPLNAKGRLRLALHLETEDCLISVPIDEESTGSAAASVPVTPTKESGLKVIGVSHVGVCVGIGESTEFYVQDALTNEHVRFDAPREQLTLNLPSGVNLVLKFECLTENMSFAVRGTVELPDTIPAEIELNEETLGPTEGPMDWLMLEKGSGARVEPRDLIDEPPPEGLDAYSKRVHEAVEVERQRIAARLAALSLPTITGDCFVAAAVMTLAPLLPADSRSKFVDAVRYVAQTAGLGVHKAMTLQGLHGVWYGLDDMDAATFLSARPNEDDTAPPGLSASSSWDFAALALAKAPHASFLEAGRIRPVYVHDPCGCFVSHLLPRELSQDATDGKDAGAITQPPVATVSVDSAALYGTFLDALATGKTLVVEHVTPAHLPILRPYVHIHLDPGRGRAAGGVPGFLPPTAYSDAFRIIFVSDADVAAAAPAFVASCTCIDLTVSSGLLGDWAAESVVAQDGELRLEMAKILGDLDSCEQKLFAAEHHLEMLSWDVDWANPLEWYYTPSVMEALVSLQTHTVKVDGMRAKYAAVLKNQTQQRTDFGQHREKLMALFDSAEDVAVLGKRWNSRLSPGIVLNTLLKLYSAAMQKGGSGSRGRFELYNTLIGQMSSFFLRGVPPAERMTFSSLFALRQERDGGDVTDAHLRTFVTGAKALSQEEHMNYEQDCKTKITVQYQQDMRAYHDAQAEALRKRQADEEKETQEKVKKGAKKGGKKRDDTLSQPAKAALPVDVKPAYPWLSHGVWLQLLKLAEVPVFAKLLPMLHNDPKDKSKTTREQRWQDWFTALGPKVPEYEKAPMSRFEKMLLSLTARPDKAIHSLRKYLTEVSKFIDPYASVAPLNNEVYNATASDIPVTFVVNDADANAECYQTLMAFAQSKKVKLLDDNCIAIHDGSEQQALDVISAALVSGDWVYLVNVHCASTSFLREVAGLLSACAGFDSPFRLFMTYRDQSAGLAAPVTHRPALIARSVIVSITLSHGVKNSMTAAYRNVADQTINTLKTFEWQRLLFVVMLVVALSNERHHLLHSHSADAVQASCVQNAVCAVASLKQHFTALKIGEKHKDSRLMAGSWESLRYTLAEALGTGLPREDELILKSLLDWWIHPDVVKTGMKVCNGVSLPTDPQNLANHWALIDAMPAADFTELFGLHPSCEKQATAHQLNTVRAAVASTILRRRPQGAAEGVPASVEAFVKGLPEPWSQEDMASVKAVPGKPHSSYLICLQREMLHLQAGLVSIRDDVARGVGVADVANGVVPKGWQGYASASTTGGFMVALKKCKEVLESWRAKLRIPRPLNLGRLAFPEALLTAQLQEAARAAKSTLAQCTLSCEVLSARRAPAPGHQQQPHEPLVLSGFVTSGCKWDPVAGAMTELTCKNWWSENLSRMPLVLIRVVVAADGDAALRAPVIVNGGAARGRKAVPPVAAPSPPRARSPVKSAPEEHAECVAAVPVYHGSTAGQPLLELPLLSKGVEPNHWVLRHAHILCRDEHE